MHKFYIGVLKDVDAPRDREFTSFQEYFITNLNFITEKSGLMMKLEQYLRVKINDKIRPLFIKTECEVCGSKDKLHLHHIHLFADMVTETLNELCIGYRDTNEYSKEELKKILHVILGKHVLIKYMTLCNVCHKNEHKDDWIKVTNNAKREDYLEMGRINKEMKIRNYVFNIIVPQLEKAAKEERMYIRKERDNIKELFKKSKIPKRSFGINAINSIIDEYKLPYEVLSKRSSESANGVRDCFRYWIVVNK